ncbi:hypothetical protein CLV51_1158 [Chitinophaga niastensis]|uniref:Uncharacterized protein n=1 Tax=Chitinophaga niastensis TaxID=536980 RepID=A0A2P8H7Y9_CHINA|nr:hypothetical protein [Chitinophaga niastensis]PSL42300.1 hypothetical protein CLV51_1158 [Chitinophaga niastensis]
MENLLTILNNITPYGSENGFVELCWNQLSLVIASKEADKWTADQRDHFMVFTNFFIESGRAVFTVRDALVRDNVTDLNKDLIGELVEPLDRLDEFSVAVDLKELHETIDEYTEILLNLENYILDVAIIEFAASYFKMFFLTLHSLNIEERIKIASVTSNNQNMVYEH